MNSLGELIKEHREANKISQKDLAASLGFSSVFLFKVENGKCELPVKHISNLSRALNVSRDLIISCLKSDRNEKFSKKLAAG